MPDLSVNIDHVATVRQARRGKEPDPVLAAREAELGGAKGITVHLREDRRHIQDDDVKRLRESVGVRFNFEMAATDEMVAIARSIKPDSAMLVPEGRLEVTTEGGLDVIANERDRETLERAVFAMSQLPPETAGPLLLELAKDKDAPREARRQALFWLAHEGDEDSVAELTALLTQ